MGRYSQPRQYKNEVIKMIKLIRIFKEGLRVFHCDNCKHDFNVPKDHKDNVVQCFYCGAVEVKTSDLLPII
jgi:ribosomal protein S27E